MVKIVGAPGYADFEAELIMVVSGVDGEAKAVVGDPETLEIFVIPSRHLEEL
jgi:hypothetical protein